MSAASAPAGRPAAARCLADAAILLKHPHVPAIGLCNSIVWIDRLAHLVRPAPVMLNVGANKGYTLVEFLARFGSRHVTFKNWSHQIGAYAHMMSSGRLE